MTPISGSNNRSQFRPAQIYFDKSRSTYPCTSHRRPGQYSKGFTLLELMLVLTIIGLASILVVPNVGNLDSRTFSVQVREAHSLLNHARRDAVVRGQPSSIGFMPANSEDSCTTESATRIRSWHSDDIALRFLHSTDLEEEIESCIDVIFYPEGGSTGGTLFFSMDNQQTRLEIDPFSGRISQLAQDEF